MAKTITHDEKLNAFWGNEDHLTVAQQKSFTQLIFELLSEKEPTSQQLKIFELILNLSIDHGPETPSAVETIKAAKEGKTISESVAAGVVMISDSHGGAIEPAMELLYSLKESQPEAGRPLDERIKNLVDEYLKEGKRMAGFGHRIYEVDPRAQLILNTLTEANLGQEYVEIAREVEKELEAQKGKKLPLNIDGAIAVALCSFGWDSKLGKAVFLIARTPGLCGQYLTNS
ncbi:MAG: Citrate synthase [Candidatus Daviesbacteria bacterium GW2011_GWA2_38_24]|uniref:citrate synthase (unknown stereospecificity) n=1 Tax=Candidatus Daviesbacteria bacterium GW2011_GWA2_38_24 TaxID=1618422 RepID=A0A0G0JRD1_9BACT|nr:MAG: Citrate synthase [Candidatus Daviesbacteria bacterium GW2011_GWA2_38_24]OGE23485.1 MAG: hypothetical protein A2688_01575 [Candidatus Daviesbacteria bacterium RIFCSPHIGHO2_01_FULL_38_8]